MPMVVIEEREQLTFLSMEVLYKLRNIAQNVHTSMPKCRLLAKN